MSSTPMIVINGAIGSGKTTVLSEMSELLSEADVRYCAVDLDALNQVEPRPKDDPFHMRLGARNLATVWANAAGVGAERIIVASVIEEPNDLALIAGAVPNADVFVCRLQAPLEVLADRIRRREVGSALDWHLTRAIELAAILQVGIVDNAVVETASKSPREIALEVLGVAAWPPVASP